MIPYIKTNIRHKVFKDKVFLTTDNGRYCSLTLDEWKDFKLEIIYDETKEKLHKAGLILDENNFKEQIDINKLKNDCIYSGTSLHIIVTTLRCNMSCLYCQVGRKYKDKEGYDMDIETAKKTVDFIFQSPNDDITIEFQGGEPTLNLDVLKFIIKYAQDKNKLIKKNLEITMVTNMTTMNEALMNYFIDKGVDVCTSLDGNKEVHNHNRKYDEDNHKQVTYWIKRFNDEYIKRGLSNRMSALVTLTNLSLKFYKEIINEYISLGIEVIHLRNLTKLGFAKKSWDNISYTADEYLEFWKKSVEHIEELKKKGICINERMVLMMEEKIANDKEVNYMDLRNPCGAVIGQIAYNHEGDIYSCDEARMMKNDIFKIGNVHKTKYIDAISCDKCKNILDASILSQYKACDECIYFPYCGICPVLNYEESGSLITDIMNSDRCKILKYQYDWVVNKYFLK